MVCGDFCGRNWVFGSAGVCDSDVNPSVCVCPQGFSGRDDWKFYENSCHVSETLQVTIWSFSLFVTCCTTLFALGGLIVLCFRFDMFKRKQPVEAAPMDEEVNCSSRSLGSASLRKFKTQKMTQRDAMLTLFVLMVWGAMGIVYYATFLMGVYRYEGYWYKDLAVCIAGMSVFSGIWLLANIFLRSLPPLVLYCKLFHLDNNIFTRYPNLADKVAWLHIGVVWVFSLVFLFIIPQMYPERRDHADYVYFLFACIVVINFSVFSVTLCLIIKSLLKELQNLLTAADTNTQTRRLVDPDQIQKSITTINLMLCVIYAIGPLAITSMLIMTSSKEARMHTYILINAIALLGNLGCSFTTYMLINRIMRPSKKDESNNNKKSVNDPYNQNGIDQDMNNSDQDINNSNNDDEEEESYTTNNNKSVPSSLFDSENYWGQALNHV